MENRGAQIAHRGAGEMMFGRNTAAIVDHLYEPTWVITYSNNTLHCFFCKRDLSHAHSVNYVAEGPICSMCLAKMKTPIEEQVK